jgi:hypothetical protein
MTKTSTLSLDETNRDKIAKLFARLKQEVMSDIDAALDEEGLERESIEAGHKIIAARTTVSTRIYNELCNIFCDPISELKSEFGIDAAKERISQNNLYIRFTTHPTEGQNLRAIKEKDGVVQIQSLLAQALVRGEVLATDFTKLLRIAEELKIDTSEIAAELKEGKALDFEQFSQLCSSIRRIIIGSFIKNPIHHVEKMTVQDERDLLLYHMDHFKKATAKIAVKHSDVVSVNDAKCSSWAFDMDGKPHVHAGNGMIFEYQSQEKFFGSLLTYLEDFSSSLEISGHDEKSAAFRSNVFQPIQKIYFDVRNHILLGREAKNTEQLISEILSSYEKSAGENLGDFFAEIKNYVESSQCKAASNGFTTREEIDKTNAALAEIKKICGIESNSFDDKIELIADNFDKFSTETKRQLMCMMESAAMHSRHEHIISQFDCQLESYKNTLRLFEIAKKLPAYHEKIPYFRSYFDKKSTESGFNLYAQIFSHSSIAAASESMVELSPLAEDENTIPKLIEFTRAMLADPECVDYIKRCGGVIRQTRSNSDGSSSLGAYKVTLLYLQADTEIKKMVEAAGFKFALLQGVGANDIERLATWTIEQLQSEFTAQGGDAQQQSLNRIMHMLTKNPDPSKEALLELKKAYEGGAPTEALCDFYLRCHNESEKGIEIEIDGKIANSADLVHRGLIQAAVVKKLGNLSSRPESRVGDVKAAVLRENSMDVFDPSVFNRNMRRIGVISSHRASGVATFCLAPFFQKPEGFDEKLVADLNQIPLFQNNIFSAVFALGVADIESFALTNGVDIEIAEETILQSAAKYDEFLEINRKKGKEAALEFAQKNHFNTADEMRAAHMCWQINSCKNVLRNALEPIICNSSPEIRDQMEKIFNESENSPSSIRRYNSLVIKCCEILVNDPALSKQTKEVFSCIGQQVSNVCREGNFYDTRSSLIQSAHDALKDGDINKFNKSCEWLAIIMRSAGNPVSPGRKVHELTGYFDASFGERRVAALPHSTKLEITSPHAHASLTSFGFGARPVDATLPFGARGFHTQALSKPPFLPTQLPLHQPSPSFRPLLEAAKALKQVSRYLPK